MLEPQASNRIVAGTLCMLLGLAPVQAAAFELTPSPTKAERLVANRTYGIKFRAIFPLVHFGTHRYADQVHEGLTQLGHECPLTTLKECADADLGVASMGVIGGVRWNDDPPFQFKPGQGRYRGCPKDAPEPPTVSFALTVDCWLLHFRDAAKLAAANPRTYTSGDGTMLARSHFGDLQFLHSMAATRDIAPAETKRKILMWAEFMWRLQSAGADRIAKTTPLGKVPVTGLQEHFPVQEERSVELLFTVGRPWMRLQLRDMAFGSLLHMVQDSFAGGHVTRRGGISGDCSVPEVVEFHTYAGQDKDEHSRRDTLDSAAAKLASEGGRHTLLDVMRKLVRLRDDLQSWEQVRPYLDSCVYRLAKDVRVSSAGVGG